MSSVENRDANVEILNALVTAWNLRSSRLPLLPSVEFINGILSKTAESHIAAVISEPPGSTAYVAVSQDENRLGTLLDTDTGSGSPQGGS